jgi:hypothetical protein
MDGMTQITKGKAKAARKVNTLALRVQRHIHPKLVKASSRSRIYLELLSCAFTAMEAHSHLFAFVSIVWVMADFVLVLAGKVDA